MYFQGVQNCDIEPKWVKSYKKVALEAISKMEILTAKNTARIKESE